MQAGGRPGAEARRLKGWFGAHRYLVLRRLSQVLILALFLAGPWFGAWVVTGNLASSLTLDLLPLTDPLLLLQVFATGHVPELTALIGGLIVLAFYLLVGGRVYCSWVCPINPVTDAAEWLRCRFNIKAGAHFSDQTRYWLLGAILLVAGFLFIWQVPHFWLLMILLEEQYARAGLPTLGSSFSKAQLHRVSFMWIMAAAATGLGFPAMMQVGLELAQSGQQKGQPLGPGVG